jgi:HPt (histidine-containing phosphotransfer) domain-containing protein
MKQTQIDQSVLHDLYGGCQESMNEVFSEFLSGYSEMLNNLSSAYESGDLMQLKRMLHFHGPSFMYIGLPGISAMFKNLEMQCLNAENPFRVHADYRELSEAVQEAWTEVCNVSGGYSEAV